MIKILFVCLGNICRSPAAEAIMKKKCQQAGLSEKIYCDSAGTSGYHQDEPADSRMIEFGLRNGYNLDSLSRKFEASQDFDRFDLIITMDDENFSIVTNQTHSELFLKNVKTMCSFMTESGITEVPDPYYGGPSGFQKVFNILENACDGLIADLKTTFA